MSSLCPDIELAEYQCGPLKNIKLLKQNLGRQIK